MVVVAVVLAVYIAEMLLLLRSRRGIGRGAKPSKTEPVEPELMKFERIDDDIEQLREQVLALKAEIQELKDAPQADFHTTQTPYSQAIQLAKQGVAIAEVAAQCGISRAEAELIVAMHNAKST
ncbi:MAG: DUF2802 domain-containing protein [Sulfuricellaceae bacterium]|nr:DUF2802 domain-containing protein [Sulfuricellaceae bacterium]